MSITRRKLFHNTAAILAGATLLAGRPVESKAASKYPLFIDGLGFPGGISMGEGAALLEQEVNDIEQSGLVAIHQTVGSVGTMAPLEAFEAIVRDITLAEADINLHPGTLARVRTSEDVQTAADSGRTGLIYGLQDGVSFEDDLGRLDALHHLGVRVIQPTYNRRNLLGDGCMEPADAGLSRVGREAIETIQSLNMLVDLSHCGRQTTADAIEVAIGPIAFSHTGCDALVRHPRHRTDAEIRAIAESGGVTGIFVMPYLSKGKQPTAADVIRHMEHAINVAGEDHVGIGTDGAISAALVTDAFKASFREITRARQEAGIAAPYETAEGYLFASDLNSPDRFSTLAELLAQRGHSPARIEKVLGGNFMRLFGSVWG
ncbi:MAG: dipeptidase [Congregibacter sp.]